MWRTLTKVSALFLLHIVAAYPQATNARPGAKCLLARAKQLLSRTDSAPKIVELLDAANAIFAETAPDDPAFAESLELRTMFYRGGMKNNLEQWKCDVAPLVQQALQIREARAGDEPDDLALALELQADVLGRTEAGKAYWQRANKIRMAHVALTFPEAKQSFSTFALRLEKTDMPPTIAKKVEPEYSIPARHAGLECFGVFLRLSIDTEGVPGEFRLQQACGYGFDEKAVEAVRQWRFHPAMRNGEPIAVPASVEVNFRLIP